MSPSCLSRRASILPIPTVTAPEEYKFLTTFRPGTSKEHTQFHGEPAQVLLKGLQIATGSTLGLLAWDRNDRPTAARRYKETLDLAISHPAFNDIALSSPHFERWIAHDVQTMKDNLFMLMQNDSLNVALLKAHGIEGGDLRKQTIAIPNVKVTGDQVEFQGSIQLATDACASCSTRGVKLQRCGRCKKVACQFLLAHSVAPPLTFCVRLWPGLPEGSLEVRMQPRIPFPTHRPYADHINLPAAHNIHSLNKLKFLYYSFP